MPLVGDSVRTGHRFAGESEVDALADQTFHFRHNGDVANVAFADGHVEKFVWQTPTFASGFNNDQANDSGLGAGTDKGYVESNEGKLIEVKGIKARYVRSYTQGNTVDDLNQVTEVEVWGLPAK